jgi:hypothetical protein
MSESFPGLIGKVNYAKYIDEIQEEIRRISAYPMKSPQDVESAEKILQDLIRRQSAEISREMGLAGSQIFVFMLSVALISTAWVSYTLRRETSDLSKSPEDRLALIDMFESMNIALENVINEASRHADAGR